MKKLIYGIIVLHLLASCKQETEKTLKVTELEKTNPITDPNHFVGNKKAQAMILGVFHFQNSGADDYKPKFPFNILESNRQKELENLLDKIEEYQPTKILIERNRIKYDSIINNQYSNYLNGSFSIEDKSNEVYQISFKLAQRLGHKKVYPSDASADWFGVELDWDKYDGDEYSKELGQFEKENRYDYESLYEMHDSLKTVQSINEHFITINSPDDRLKDHQAYLTGTVLTGAGDNYLGADSVGRWYRRNLRIFANAYDITDFDKEERLLLIYGSGHVWQLRQFFTDSPDFEYIEVNEYLKG